MAFKTPLWVGAGTEMLTLYLTSPLSDDILQALSYMYKLNICIGTIEINIHT